MRVGNYLNIVLSLKDQIIASLEIKAILNELQTDPPYKLTVPAEKFSLNVSKIFQIVTSLFLSSNFTRWSFVGDRPK